MKTYISTLNTDSEFRLTQRIDRLEKRLYGMERAIFYGCGLAFIVGFSEFLVHALSHA